MNTDKFGQLIFTENDLFGLYMSDPDRTLKNVLVDKDIDFPDILELQNIPVLIKYINEDRSLTEFDQTSQDEWFMPSEYRNMDIAKYILSLCQSDVELQRAGQELLLYQEYDMFDLLRYLKYLVDTMRKHDILWGVGRGSSVASFVLFLLGVHRINSIYYDLPIEEFLK